MPDLLAVERLDSTIKGFSLAEKVEELRKKLHLKKKECECYRESSRTEMLANERIIRMMRSNNDIRRVLFSDERGDKKMITTVLQDDKAQMLKLNRLTITRAIEEVDEKVSEAENVLNMMRYVRQKLEKAIEVNFEKIEQVTSAELYDKKNDQTASGMSGVTKLENDLDKAVIRHDAARIINQRYRSILDHMKKENREYPARLDTMEAALKNQQEELAQLEYMGGHALQTCDDAKEQLKQVEKATYDAKKERENEMTTLKAEVARRQHKNLDMFGEAREKDKKTFRASLLMANLDHRSLVELHDKIARNKKILDYQHLMQSIKTATSVHDIEDVVSRVMAQNQVHDKLEAQMVELEARCNKERKELSELRNTYNDMKYSGEMTLNKGRKLLEETQEYLVKEEQTREDTVRLLDKNGKLLADVKVGVNTLLDKLLPVKLKPPAFNYCSTGDVFDEIKLCKQKIEQLQLNVSDFMKTDEEIHSGTTAELETNMNFQEFLVSQLPTDNIRIHVDEVQSTMQVFDNDGPDNEGVLSRVDHKMQSQKLIDLKERKVRRKKRKGK